MDINELNQWIETPEGTQWLESQKRPLLDKRDELLSQLKSANGKLSELERRNSQTESNLSEERAALTSALVDQELSRLLKQAHVFEVALPSTIAALRETYGIRIQANGPDRKAIGTIKEEDEAEKQASLTEIVNLWRQTPEAAQVIENKNNGGGSPGSLYKGAVKPPPLQKLSGQALAAMSDDEFRNMRTAALNNAKDF